jgi:hypothetical protein
VCGMRAGNCFEQSEDARSRALRRMQEQADTAEGLQDADEVSAVCEVRASDSIGSVSPVRLLPSGSEAQAQPDGAAGEHHRARIRG